MARGSRYDQTRPFVGQNGQAPAFPGYRARPIGMATGVIEYVVKQGDRLDLLALNFYVDSRKWWRILDANPEIVFGGSLLLDEIQGQVILIPKARG